VTKPAETVDPTKKTSLFGSSVTPAGDNNQKFGLFGATKPAEGGDVQKPASLFGGGGLSGGLFGSAPAIATGGTSLFGGKPPASGGLFGGTPATGTGSLFGNANAGSNLFKFPATEKKEEDEDEDELEEGEKSPPIYADNDNIEFKGAGAQTMKPSPYTKLFEVSPLRLSH